MNHVWVYSIDDLNQKNHLPDWKEIFDKQLLVCGPVTPGRIDDNFFLAISREGFPTAQNQVDLTIVGREEWVLRLKKAVLSPHMGLHRQYGWFLKNPRTRYESRRK